MKTMIGKSGLALLLSAGVVYALYVALGYESGGGVTYDPGLRMPVVAQYRTTNYRLVEDFIRWYETNYIQNMRRVGWMPTDIADLVKEIGLERAVERYSTMLRMYLDYAMMYPDRDVIPEADLERICQSQYEYVLTIIRSTKRWVDVNNENVKKGIIEAYGIGARVMVPFFQKLLSSPTPPGNADFKDLIRSAFTREEYASVVGSTTRASQLFHDSLKEGVTRYAPWAPWVKGMLDSACRQDNAVTRSTVEQIYGD